MQHIETVSETFSRNLELVSETTSHPELERQGANIDLLIANLTTEIASLQQKNQELMTTAFSAAQTALAVLQNQENVAKVWYQAPRGGDAKRNRLVEAVVQATQVLSEDATHCAANLKKLQDKLAIITLYRQGLTSVEQIFSEFMDQLAQIETLTPEQQLVVLHRLEDLRIQRKFLTNQENTPFVAGTALIQEEGLLELNEICIKMLLPHFQSSFPDETLTHDHLLGLVLLKLLIRLGVPLKHIIMKYRNQQREVSWIGTLPGQAVPAVFATFVDNIASSILRSFNSRETDYIYRMGNPDLRSQYIQLLNLPTDVQTV